MENEKLISIHNLKKYFPVKKSSFLQKEQLYVKANDGITIDINRGETFGLVGESGCGKSTLGRVLLQLYPQTQGNTIYYGKTIYEYKPAYVERILKNLPEQKKPSRRIGEYNGLGILYQCAGIYVKCTSGYIVFDSDFICIGIGVSCGDCGG